MKQRAWEIGTCLSVVFVLRVLVLIVGFVATYTQDTFDSQRATGGLPWIAWDAMHYYKLALDGYPPPAAAAEPTGQALVRVAYFPLYPMISSVLAQAMPLWIALVVVANVSAMIGFGFFYAWVYELTHNSRTACLSTLVIAAFPGAVFFCAGLTEGTFFMLTAITLWLAARRHYWRAAGVCGIAAAARPTAVAVAITLCLLALVENKTAGEFLRGGAQRVARRLPVVALIGITAMGGSIAYVAFLTVRYREPGWQTYMRAQESWAVAADTRRSQDMPSVEGGGAPRLTTPHERYSTRWYIAKIVEASVWNRGIGFLMLLVALLGFYKPLGIPRPLFVLPLVIWFLGYLPNAGLRASSVYRFEMAGLPLFLLVTLWLATPKRRWVLAGLMVLSLGLQLYYAVRFSRGLWVG